MTQEMRNASAGTEAFHAEPMQNRFIGEPTLSDSLRAYKRAGSAVDNKPRMSEDRWITDVK